MTKIVGIVNITPDSFSSDGLLNDVDTVKDQITTFIKDGVEIIDVGAESTRPGAILLSHQEEWQRFEKILDFIAENIAKTEFSIDTRHAQTILKFINEIKPENIKNLIINDVSGATDSELIEIAKEYNIKIILTHSLTIPADPEITIPEDADAVEVVTNWIKNLVKKHYLSLIHISEPTRPY